MSPAINHQIGGPEGFYLGELLWKIDTSIKFKRNLVLYTSFGFNIYDTFDELNNPSQSTIPKVRSDIQEYLKEGKQSIQRMQLGILDSLLKIFLQDLILVILSQCLEDLVVKFYIALLKKNTQ